MNIKEKKEYLSLYRLQQAKISRLQLLENEFPESSERYQNQMKDAIELREKIEREIEEVDGGLLTEVLCLKYLCGRSLEEVALRINYSLRQTERLFAKALEKFTLSRYPK